VHTVSSNLLVTGRTSLVLHFWVGRENRPLCSSGFPLLPVAEALLIQYAMYMVFQVQTFHLVFDVRTSLANRTQYASIQMKAILVS
jgi:hypothetical protein